MVKISVTEDCGNAPKKQFIKDFLVANANASIEAVSSMLTGDVRLDIPGRTSVNGKESVEKFLISHSARGGVLELVVHNILSHGDRCAANGILKFEDNSEVSFCSVYAFDSHGKNAKLKNITSYSNELK